MHAEHEIKFALTDCQDFAVRLTNRAALRTPWHFEHNTVYDKNAELFSDRKLLRLRQVGPTALLTYKEPDKTQGAPNIKSMREIECRVDSAPEMGAILRKLGYTPRLCYEKFRMVWQLDQGTLFLDILPFGHFLEIEANAQDIFGIAHALGLDPAHGTDASYHALHQQWRTIHAMPPREDILFTPTEKTRLAARLGLADVQGEP